ncbi:hypothetical protein Bcav_1366 [Beutenbergia cavernae DSM 12333]|uniref:Uncharacterized protein n=1 Tax=Beutenbergia cavernae (strain ATCC BAA-8 / DSM 12333 / CCUG 43141 / JCM 11478 / NBRC 16432 / NCIMB 13614 / HKI 0122) TaxID=471853 RepID=C5C2D9_BEUC1|nr:hypothetical protein Bcav_1366 [Beutenbergia cavernae DSM 12333]
MTRDGPSGVRLEEMEATTGGREVVRARRPVRVLDEVVEIARLRRRQARRFDAVPVPGANVSRERGRGPVRRGADVEDRAGQRVRDDPPPCAPGRERSRGDGVDRAVPRQHSGRLVQTEQRRCGHRDLDRHGRTARAGQPHHRRPGFGRIRSGGRGVGGLRAPVCRTGVGGLGVVAAPVGGLGVVAALTDGLGVVAALTDGLGVVAALTDGLGVVAALAAGLGVVAAPVGGVARCPVGAPADRACAHGVLSEENQGVGAELVQGALVAAGAGGPGSGVTGRVDRDRVWRGQDGDELRHPVRQRPRRVQAPAGARVRVPRGCVGSERLRERRAQDPFQCVVRQLRRPWQRRVDDGEDRVVVRVTEQRGVDPGLAGVDATGRERLPDVGERTDERLSLGDERSAPAPGHTESDGDLVPRDAPPSGVLGERGRIHLRPGRQLGGQRPDPGRGVRLQLVPPGKGLHERVRCELHRVQLREHPQRPHARTAAEPRPERRSVRRRRVTAQPPPGRISGVEPVCERTRRHQGRAQRLDLQVGGGRSRGRVGGTGGRSRGCARRTGGRSRGRVGGTGGRSRGCARRTGIDLRLPGLPLVPADRASPDRCDLLVDPRRVPVGVIRREPRLRRVLFGEPRRERGHIEQRAAGRYATRPLSRDVVEHTNDSPTPSPFGQAFAFEHRLKISLCQTRPSKRECPRTTTQPIEPPAAVVPSPLVPDAPTRPKTPAQPRVTRPPPTHGPPRKSRCVP